MGFFLVEPSTTSATGSRELNQTCQERYQRTVTKDFPLISILPNTHRKILPSHFKTPIFPSIIIKFHLQKHQVQEFNSCVHDGTLWIATVTFPSDRTSKLLKERSNKNYLHVNKVHNDNLS